MYNFNTKYVVKKQFFNQFILVIELLSFKDCLKERLFENIANFIQYNASILDQLSIFKE